MTKERAGEEDQERQMLYYAYSKFLGYFSCDDSFIRCTVYLSEDGRLAMRFHDIDDIFLLPAGQLCFTGEGFPEMTIRFVENDCLKVTGFFLSFVSMAERRFMKVTL